MFVVLVTTGFTVKFNVAMESHPVSLIKFAVYVPATLIVCPFQVYGSWLSQIVVFVVLVTTGFTVKFNVAMESQLATLIKLAVYVPAILIVWPFQVYGSWLSQIVIFVVLITTGFT